MKKPIYFAICLFLLVILFPGCSLIYNMNEVDVEKIGAEYMVIEGYKPDPADTHGTVENYKSSLSKNRWTTEFDYMNSTGYQAFNIETDDELLIKSKVDKGEVWIKITQGDLLSSEIQKVQAVNNREISVDLSQWKKGGIFVWLVVEDGEDGLIQIEHIEK